MIPRFAAGFPSLRLFLYRGGNVHFKRHSRHYLMALGRYQGIFLYPTACEVVRVLSTQPPSTLQPLLLYFCRYAATLMNPVAAFAIPLIPAGRVLALVNSLNTRLYGLYVALLPQREHLHVALSLQPHLRMQSQAHRPHQPLQLGYLASPHSSILRFVTTLRLSTVVLTHMFALPLYG